VVVHPKIEQYGETSHRGASILNIKYNLNSYSRLTLQKWSTGRSRSAVFWFSKYNTKDEREIKIIKIWTTTNRSLQKSNGKINGSLHVVSCP
jgi:hypothetical protein